MPFLPDTNVWISLLKNPGGKLVVKCKTMVSLCPIVASSCRDRYVTGSWFGIWDK